MNQEKMPQGLYNLKGDFNMGVYDSQGQGLTHFSS